MRRSTAVLTPVYMLGSAKKRMSLFPSPICSCLGNWSRRVTDFFHTLKRERMHSKIHFSRDSAVGPRKTGLNLSVVFRMG